MVKKIVFGVFALCSLPAMWLTMAGGAASSSDWLGDTSTPFWQAEGASPNELAFLECVGTGEASGPEVVSASGQYRGQFQFRQSTWNGVLERWENGDWRGIPPEVAPADVQWRAALLLLRERGWNPWPTTGRACRSLL